VHRLGVDHNYAGRTDGQPDDRRTDRTAFSNSALSHGPRSPHH